MTNIQFIKRDDHIEFAIVPIEIWQRVAPLVEELEDEALFNQAKADDDGSAGRLSTGHRFHYLPRQILTNTYDRDTQGRY
jgi:hypothetical protein